MRHSGSGSPGETVTAAVRAGDTIVWVEVTDRVALGCRNWVLQAGMLKAAAGFSSLRTSRRVGGGYGAAAGR